MEGGSNGASCSALLGCSGKSTADRVDIEAERGHSLSFRHTTPDGEAQGAPLSFGERVLSFFTAKELKESIDEWKFPEPGQDEGEQLVGRQIMLDELGVGQVTDFHDLTDFNDFEKGRNANHKPWSSPYTVRFFEHGLDEHGMERTVKLLEAAEVKELGEIVGQHGHSKLRSKECNTFNPSHHAYMVKVLSSTEVKDTEASDDVGLDQATCAHDDIDMIFKIVDKDGSGLISFQEFASWLTRRQVATQGFVTPGNLKEWQVSWTKFDQDGSHTLSPIEFKKVLEDFADKDWSEAVDPQTKRHYYYHKRTRETKWAKPSQDTEINDFLVRNGVKQQSDDRLHRGPGLTINVQKTMEKLRVKPNYYRGRRNFFCFVVYLVLLMVWWLTIADINNGRGVETGLHNRISAIQFEVTPGPHFSQSIRATNWAGVRTLGDVHDLTLALVENLYSDDDSTYFTPADRVELKSNTLQHVYRNSEFAKLWEAVGIDTDRGNVRRNCSNWVIADPNDGGFAGECEFFDRCTGDVLAETQRIVALRGTRDVEMFAARELECREQRCENRYNMVFSTCGVSQSAGVVELTACSNPGCKVKLRLANLWDSDCRQWMAAKHPTLTDDLISTCLVHTAASNEECTAIDTAAVSGVELKLKCEARVGCKYWTELWHESCVSATVYDSRKRHGPSRQRYNTEENAGLINMHNHPLPWLTLKMNRRKLSSCDLPAECPSTDCPTGNCPCPFPGYVPGTADSPSVTCPRGCDLTWAMASTTASCTGTSSNSARCDIDGATDGTAECPPGCTHTLSTSGNPETCLQSSTLSDYCLAARNTAELCAQGGVFTKEIDYDDFIGAETGSVYKYDERVGGFPFYIRLDDSAPQTWIGLLELLRADRWLSHNTQDFTIECLTLNRNTYTLGFWSLSYEIDLAGMIRQPRGFVVRSFPLSVANPDQRQNSQQILVLAMLICLVIDFLVEAWYLVHTAKVELGQGIEPLQITARTQMVSSSQLAVVSAFNSGFCLSMIVLTFRFIFGLQDVDFARIEPDLVGYSFTGMVSDSAGDADVCRPAGMFDPECEIGEKIELMTALGTGIESWVKYRNLWSLFCLYNALRLLGKVYWARKFSVLLVTIRTAANQLGYFFLLLGGSGWVFSWMFHLSYGRRFFAFRSLESTMFALMAPVLGGDSSLEAAVMESSRAGDNLMSVGIYLIYASYVVFLVYNVFIAIIVDGYEDAKDLDGQRINAEDLVKDALAVNELFDTMETHPIAVPECKKNVLYIKVPDAKVYSCGSDPVEEEAIRALKGYEFMVSVVQPWHGIPKVDPTKQRTTKASFTYLVKIERSRAPDDAPATGWPRGFTLQALVRSRRFGKRGNVWREWVNSTCANVTWAKKIYRTLAKCNREHTLEEKWARYGLNFLERTLTDYINDQIEVHARNLMLDGTLDHDESAELEQHAKTRDLAKTHGFITERIKGLRKRADAARSAALYRSSHSDPTLQKRLQQAEEEIRRFKVIESLAATELSHRDLVEALSSPRDWEHPDGVMNHRPSVRCPKPLIKKLWKAFGTAEDEDVSDAIGPPATWKQMERLDDKVTAILNCEPSADTESMALPALVAKINGIQDTLSKVVPRLENLAVQVDSLAVKFVGLATPLPEDVADPPPPPPVSSSAASVRDSSISAKAEPPQLEVSSFDRGP